MKKSINELAKEEAVLKSEFLQHIFGGMFDRCSAPGSKYNDSVYVKPPPKREDLAIE